MAFDAGMLASVIDEIKKIFNFLLQFKWKCVIMLFVNLKSAPVARLSHENIMED